MNPKFTKQWKNLEKLGKDSSFRDLQELFASNPERTEQFSFTFDELYFDFSKNWLTTQILDELKNLATSAHLKEKINSLFAGDIVNQSENKPASHVITRKTESPNDFKNHREIMFNIADKYLSGEWLSGFGKKIKNVVNIGIGGSYLGPRLAIDALSNQQTKNDIKVYYFASVDTSNLQSILQNINIAETLFCISSKSLGTIETKKNTKSIIKLLNSYEDYQPDKIKQSLVIATTNIEKAKELGVPESHIMPFDNSIGGRFSVWSSIGFPLLMAIGKSNFNNFLAGAEHTDNHFQNTPFHENIPVIMALMSIWYRNFVNLPAYAVIPYDSRLSNISAWMQQLMMESNGKMVDNNGDIVDYSTSPFIFGEHGQLSQHAFFQAFHQGKDSLPIDFIGVMEKGDRNQTFLLANMLAQSAALLRGNRSEKNSNSCPGNRPSTVILMKKLTPFTLGQLLAVYEHMVYTQAVIWNINCFDQPGVELGKKLACEIVNQIENSISPTMEMDPSTKNLLNKVLNNE